MLFAQHLLRIFVFLALPFSLEAAKFEKPPIETYYNAHNTIALLKAEKKLANDSISFKTMETVLGEDTDSIVLTTSSKSYKSIEIGKAFLIVYTKYQKNPLIRKVTELIPSGPKILSTNFVGDALFQPTKNLMTIMKSPQLDDKNDKRLKQDELIDLLLQESQQINSANRNFAILQLSRQKGLLAALSHGQGLQLFKQLKKEGWPDKHLSLLVEAGAREGSVLDLSLKQLCSKTITGFPQRFDLTSMQPHLALSCTSLFRRIGQVEDLKVLSSLLTRNNPGVAKAAFKTMSAIDREASLSQAQALLQTQGTFSPKLLPEVDRFLQRQLKLKRAAVR